MNDALNQIHAAADLAVYRIGTAEPGPLRLLLSTPETRRICNDPLLAGVAYTAALRRACAAALRALVAERLLPAPLVEAQTVVLHVLRGGLNFGLREAFADALGWNRHASAFISAQRARRSSDPGQWHITESDYAKVYLPARAAVVFGDVVATGTSLEFALRRLTTAAESSRSGIASLLFFTIGGRRAEEIVSALDRHCRAEFPEYRGATVVYFEGRFTVADSATPVRLKEPGTDLLRLGALLAPEFLEAQYEQPSYPLERCAIYDAGSRAFWLPDYYADLADYWERLGAMATAGLGFRELLAERCPACDPARFGTVDLSALCAERLKAMPVLHS